MVCFLFPLSDALTLTLSFNSAYWQKINDAPDKEVGSNRDKMCLPGCVLINVFLEGFDEGGFFF